MKAEDLIEKYPWLSRLTTSEDYLDPSYYDRILKDYSFEGKSDLIFLRNWAEKISRGSNIVEFGPGSGRATEIVVSSAEDIKKFTLVDLSEGMLARCREKFSGDGFMEYVHSDTVDFFLATDRVYDAAFSLWSLSHSVHQNLQKLGMEEGTEKVRSGLQKFFLENLGPGGSFFLIHFDSLSPEQKISIRQRRRNNVVFAKDDVQSPSKLLLDDVLDELKTQGLVDFSCTHSTGAPIEFSSIEQALEYYLNFHMETHFNQSGSIEEIIAELSSDIEKCRDNDGVIRITPGAFIYVISRAV